MAHHRQGSRLGAILTVAAVLLLVGAALWLFLNNGETGEETLGSMDQVYGDLDVRVVDGVKYVQRLNLRTLLVMGVDQTAAQAETRIGYRNGGQADFLLLIVLDQNEGTCHALQINRDTIADVTILGLLGNVTGKRKLQICLQHNFGSTEAECASWQKDAVENLLGVKIDDYMSMRMDQIGLLNQALGGVKVTFDEDLTYLDPSFVQGSTITLTDTQAVRLARARRGVGDGTNVARMARQHILMDAIMETFSSKAEKSADFALEMLDTIWNAFTTSLKKGELANELNNVAKYGVREVEQLPGTSQVSADDGFMEFYADPDGIDQWVLNVYYKPARQ